MKMHCLDLCVVTVQSSYTSNDRGTYAGYSNDHTVGDAPDVRSGRWIAFMCI